MSTHAGDIFFDVKLNRKPYDQGMRNLDRGAGALAGKIGKKIAAGLSIAAFGKFIKNTTAAGASLNAMNAIVDAALPNMTKQVDNFAKHAGKAFGLSETQAKGFVGNYATMASAMGYTEKQAYQMSTALTGLAGDVASYYHISQDDAANKLNAIFTGETEALKSLGVVMTQNALDAFALQQGFGKVTSQMTEMEKTTLRYQFVMDRLKLASGDFAKYANTWSGSIATIKLNWSNFMATVGQGIINILLPLLQLIARISNALTALGSAFLGWTKRVMGIKSTVNNALGKKTQNTLQNAGNAIGNVGSGLKGAGTNAKNAKKQVQALKRELMGFDQITKLTKQDASTGTSGAGGVGGVGGGGLDFGETESEVQNFTDKVNDYLSKIKIPEPLQKALDHLKNSFADLFDVLCDAGKWAWKNILEPLGKWTIDKLAPALVETLASAFDLLVSVLKLLGEIFKPLWELILKPFFAYIGEKAIGLITNLGETFKWLAGFVDAAREGFVKLRDKTAEVVENVKSKWDELKRSIKDILPSISVTLPKWDDIKKKWNDLQSNIKDKTAEVKLKIGTTWSDLKKKWNDLLGNFKDKTADVKLKIGTSWSDLKKKWNNLLDNFKGKTVEVGIKVASFTKGLKNAWNALKAHFKAGGGVYANGHWSKIQKYAAGGAPNQGQLFWAREKGPELVGTLGGHTAVMNNDQIVASVSAGVARAMSGVRMQIATPRLAMMGSQARAAEAQAQDTSEAVNLLRQLITIVQGLDLDVQLDGESIKRNTVKRINDHTKATGQPEIIM